MNTVWTGTLSKMRVAAAEPVAYFFADGWCEKDKRVDDAP